MNRGLLARCFALVLAGGILVIGCQELPTEPTPIDLSKDQPIAVDDQVATPEEKLVRISVLENDSSLVGDDLEVTEIVAPPIFGEATIDEAVIEYVPEGDYNGTDSLRYRVSGSVLSSTARVVITVTPVNDPPIATDDAFTVDETIAVRKAQVNLDVLANDTDVDGDVLRVIRTGEPSSGMVEIVSEGLAVSYVPNPDFTGTAQFNYTISDGNGGQDLANVVVDVRPVNDPPSVTNKTYGTPEDATLIRTAGDGVLSNATDPEGDHLTALLVTDVQHGTLALMNDGSFQYDPDPDFNGGDQFEFAASDGMSQSNGATALINVVAQNDAPVAASDSYGTEEDVALDVSAPGVLANDVDIDGDALNLVVVTSPVHGDLELRGDGSFTYVPDAGFSGDDGFEYQIDDGTLASRALVSISVGEVNDVPDAAPDQYDTAANVGIFVPPPGVLENDSDEDGDPLTAVLVDSPNGDLELDGNGSFVYTPPPGFTGTDTFTYRASDGVSLSDATSAVILVTAQGNLPVAEDDEYDVAVNDVLAVPAPGVLENDTDADDDPLSAVLVDDVTAGALQLDQDGGFTYTPPSDFVGIVTFSYRARDAANVSTPATVTIGVGQ